MRDSSSGAHHLNVACGSAAFIAQAVLVADRAGPDIGDDFHILVGVGGEAGVRSNFIIVPALFHISIFNTYAIL